MYVKFKWSKITVEEICNNNFCVFLFWNTWINTRPHP